MQSATVYCSTITDPDWLNWPDCLFTEKVAVFRLKLADDAIIPPYLYAWLQPNERERAARFRRKEDHNRFVVGRIMTKVVVSKFTHRDLADIRLVPGVNSKPELAGIPDLQINLSHSGSWIVLAISSESVGVDIEKMVSDFPFEDIVSNSFSEKEQRSVESNRNPRAAFYRLWTRKEALSKATAKGMDDDFSLIPSLDGEHCIEAGIIGGDGFWALTSFTIADDYPAAIAYRPIVETPKFYTIESGQFA
ncbi:4'-phosphopantetheinyl transferase family protein [Spirosoma endbachense]|uniref:4'-phosphopantetheinyl transferase superfamily protein n=1 Tax=Spirosoma endbachense TaxID=2666025 RepID=A0A6P1VXQ5_9BACT|nr:4'-phosphopantetheinyl transferase superfamily protein [Spirosoma endbachense]QHV96577.1 4'-phosphopantetheinyl transferase superfamily protein [Spirosoma endbachense]